MRKRKYLVGAAAAAVLSLALASVSQGDYTLQNQELKVDATSGKLDKKVHGPVNSFFVDVITNYAGTTGAVDKKANNTKVYFSSDYKFTTKKLATCDKNGPGFGTSTTEAAKAACGPSQVGQGSAQIVGPIPGITAVVTAFNGLPAGGNSTILLHSRTSAGTTTVLEGTLLASDQPGFGRMLNVPVPPLPLGLAISDFKTTIGKVKLPKSGSAASAAAKKKKKPAQYYIMARCKKKTWNFQAISTFDDGTRTTATATDTCKQKKSKKKKK